MAKPKKTIDTVAITPRKANAMNLTCFIAFVVTTMLTALIMIVACILPVAFQPTAVICWVSMALEAVSAGFGFVAYWIKINAL